jgi:voltage-gated potassium channel
MREQKRTLKEKLYEIIFGVDTPLGKLFDVLLLWAILISVLGVVCESVAGLRAEYGTLLKGIEWTFTILFTIEYFLRLYSSPRPWNYAKSFFGLIDLLAILPMYVSFFFVYSSSFLVVRGLRLLRIFRILKIGRFIRELDILINALKAVRVRIFVFIGSVLTLVIIIGALMYVIEGESHGFMSIPRSMYWAIVTLTTVGYGDMTPQTVLGQTLSSVVMLLGYGIIVVPAGIFSAEIALGKRSDVASVECAVCREKKHESDALYCRKCGKRLV